MSDNVVLSWNRAALEAVRQTRMGPPIVARALHVLHAAMYDAWAAHDDLAFGSRLGDPARPLVPARPGRLGPGRARPGRGRTAVLRPHRGAAGRRHRLLGRPKRTYDSVRPVTAIRFLFAGREVLAWGGPGRGTRRIRGEDWQPYIATPPFPEYGSGHSTFSAAAAAVLARFTGSDRFGGSVPIPAGSSRVEPGTTPAADVVLSWPTFTDAAVQAPPDVPVRAGGRRAGRGRRRPGRAPAPSGTWSAWP
jgi:VCPO second helical-bundle domain